MIKGIIFDKDGTLLDYKAFWFTVAENAIGQLLEKHNIKNSSVEDVMKKLGAYEGINSIFYYGTYKDFADRFNDAVGFEAVTRDETAEVFRSSSPCGRILPTTLKLRELFQWLSDKGIKTAVVTTDEPKMTAYCLEVLKINDLLDEVYADDGISPTKPDPYYMNKFCEKYGIEADEVMMVGDTPLDMIFAKNGGCQAVGVAKDDCDKKILSEKADIVLGNVSELFDILQSAEA